jgi:catechol 2,3-dioxygenase-like lactoylglutathione lyase family enzyme
MSIVGLEAVVFGVDDVATSVRFMSDLGLEAIETGASGANLAVSPEGSEVCIRKAADAGLPPAVESGSSVREIVWAVSDRAALDALAASLSRDHDLKVDATGRLSMIGPGGFGLAFAVTAATREATPLMPAARRPNTRVTGYDRAIPDHLGHMGVFTPRVDEMADFYLNRLGFTLSDSVRGFGKFVRAPGSINHHNFLIANRPQPGMQHVSLRLRDIDEMGVATRYLEARGWQKIWGPGRHRPGSDLFVFFRNPAGALVEYHCDEDFIIDPTRWTPQEFDPTDMQIWGDRPPASMGGKPGS